MMATSGGGTAVSVKVDLLDFLPPAGEVPASVRSAFARPSSSFAAAASATSPSSAAPGASSSAAKQSASHSGSHSASQQRKALLAHLVGFEFEACPTFSAEHFRQKTKSAEENERAKRAAAASLAAGKQRVQQALWFSQAQDNALIRGVERHGLGDWGAVAESDETLRELQWPLEALPVRLAVLKESFHSDDELIVAQNIDGEEVVVLRVDRNTAAKSRATSDVPSESEDICAICGEMDAERVLLCCDGCPRVYHLDCLEMDEVPEEEEWFCPMCMDHAKDIVDDSQLDDRSWREYIKVFMDVGTAKKSSEERNADLEHQDGDELEGVVTQSFKRMVQSQDSEFEKITREIERNSGFVSDSIQKAESKLLQQFVDRYETELKGRNDKRQDGEEGKNEDDEDDDDEDDDDEEEEEDDEDDEDDDDEDDEEEEDEEDIEEDEEDEEDMEEDIEEDIEEDMENSDSDAELPMLKALSKAQSSNHLGRKVKRPRGSSSPNSRAPRTGSTSSPQKAKTGLASSSTSSELSAGAQVNTLVPKPRSKSPNSSVINSSTLSAAAPVNTLVAKPRNKASAATNSSSIDNNTSSAAPVVNTLVAKPRPKTKSSNSNSSSSLSKDAAPKPTPKLTNSSASGPTSSEPNTLVPRSKNAPPSPERAANTMQPRNKVTGPKSEKRKPSPVNLPAKEERAPKTPKIDE